METIIKRYELAQEFLADVSEELYIQASVNNLMLGICERLVKNPAAYTDPFFAAVFDAHENLLLAAVMTPPHNLILAEGADFEQGLTPLIEYLIANHVKIPGVIGPVQCAEAFYHRWQAASGLEGEVTMYQRVYELRQVRLPKLPSGHFRVAHPKDASLIAGWIQAFNREALNQNNSLNLELAERLVREGMVFLWEVDGQPVSMAMRYRPLTRSITVSGVYTPPEYRQHGLRLRSGGASQPAPAGYGV